MTQWYCRIGDKQYGPVGQDEFYNWIAQGRVGADDLIWNETMPGWRSAREVFPTTFTATAATPVPFVPGTAYYIQPHRGTMILVFGILGLVTCFIFGIVAWVMGNTDLEKMARGEMDRSGESQTKAGKICGMISVLLLLLPLLGMILFFGFTLAG